MCQAMWGADGRHSHYCNSLHWKTKLEERCERLYRDLRHNRHRGLHLPSRLAAVPQAFPLCLSAPSVLGQPLGLGLPHVWTFWFGDSSITEGTLICELLLLKSLWQHLVCNPLGFALPPSPPCSPLTPRQYPSPQERLCQEAASAWIFYSHTVNSWTKGYVQAWGWENKWKETGHYCKYTSLKLSWEVSTTPSQPVQPMW